MNDNQQDSLKMFQSVEAFFQEHSTQVAAIIPAFAAEKLNFDARLSSIINLAAEVSIPTTGYSKDKQTKREQLQTLTLSAANATILYYTHTAPDSDLVERLSRSLRFLSRQNASALVVNSRFVWETADAVKALLAPFGTTAASVDQLAIAINKFEDIRTTPLDLRSAIKRQRAQLGQEISGMTNYLRNLMDLLLRNLRMSNNLLYSQYRSARKLHKYRGRRSEKSPDKVYINAGSTKELILRNPITTADDALYLSSHSKTAEGDVIFYYSTTPAGEQLVEGISLAAGTRQATTAGALGFSAERKHLCIRNTAMQRHLAGVARKG